MQNGDDDQFLEPFIPLADSREPLFNNDTMALLSAKNLALESLFKILTRDLKFAEFIKEILLLTITVVKSEAGSILEVNHKNQALFFRAAAGRGSESISTFTVPMGQGIAGFVAESRQPLVVSDVKENQMHLRAIAASVGFDCRNLLAVPIIIRGKIFGVLELLNRIGDENYSPTDVEMITYICDMAAKAIEIRMMLGWAQHVSNKASGEAA